MYTPVPVPDFFYYDKASEKSIVITEYDVRNIQWQIAINKMNPNDFIITDWLGTKAQLRPDGFMNNELLGMNINSDYSMSLLNSIQS